MASACVLGGAGAALTLDDVVAIAAGGGVVEGEWKRRQRLGAPRGGRRRPTPLPPPSLGAPVTLDAAALDRVKKESPSPTAFKGEDGEAAAAADKGAAPAAGSALLTDAQARAVLVARTVSLMAGNTRVRCVVWSGEGNRVERERWRAPRRGPTLPPPL